MSSDAWGIVFAYLFVLMTPCLVLVLMVLILIKVNRVLRIVIESKILINREDRREFDRSLENGLRRRKKKSVDANDLPKSFGEVK